MEEDCKGTIVMSLSEDQESLVESEIKKIKLEKCSSESDLENAVISVNATNSRLSRGKLKLAAGQFKKEKRYFCRKWLEDPMLRNWLREVPGKKENAYCQFCNSMLRAHLSDLRKHSVSRKHTITELKIYGCFKEKIDIKEIPLNNHPIKIEKDIFDVPRQVLLPKKNGVHSTAKISFLGCKKATQIWLGKLLTKGLFETSNVIIWAGPNMCTLDHLEIRFRSTVRRESDVDAIFKYSNLIIIDVCRSIFEEVIPKSSLNWKYPPVFLSLIDNLSIEKVENILSRVVPIPRTAVAMIPSECIDSEAICLYSIGSNFNRMSEVEALESLLNIAATPLRVPNRQFDQVKSLISFGMESTKVFTLKGRQIGLPENVAIRITKLLHRTGATMDKEAIKSSYGLPNYEENNIIKKYIQRIDGFGMNGC